MERDFPGPGAGRPRGGHRARATGLLIFLVACSAPAGAPPGEVRPRPAPGGYLEALRNGGDRGSAATGDRRDRSLPRALGLEPGDAVAFVRGSRSRHFFGPIRSNEVVVALTGEGLATSIGGRGDASTAGGRGEAASGGGTVERRAAGGSGTSFARSGSGEGRTASGRGAPSAPERPRRAPAAKGGESGTTPGLGPTSDPPAEEAGGAARMGAEDRPAEGGAGDSRPLAEPRHASASAGRSEAAEASGKGAFEAQGGSGEARSRGGRGYADVFSLRVTADRRVLGPGDRVRMRLTAQNESDEPAREVVLYDFLDPELALVDAGGAEVLETSEAGTLLRWRHRSAVPPKGTYAVEFVLARSPR